MADFISACPYDQLARSAGGSNTYQAWLRLPKLLRLYRVLQWYRKKVGWPLILFLSCFITSYKGTMSDSVSLFLPCC